MVVDKDLVDMDMVDTDMVDMDMVDKNGLAKFTCPPSPSPTTILRTFLAQFGQVFVRLSMSIHLFFRAKLSIYIIPKQKLNHFLKSCTDSWQYFEGGYSPLGNFASVFSNKVASSELTKLLKCEFCIWEILGYFTG